jgi:hypothetical protein
VEEDEGKLKGVEGSRIGRRAVRGRGGRREVE